MKTLSNAFELAGGSVVGRAHRVAGRNNQDAWGWVLREDLAAGVVCDGCSSGARSEVGAWTGARGVLDSLSRWNELEGSVSQRLAQVRMQTLYRLHLARSAMGRDARQAVSEMLLFTIIGFVVNEHEACVFSIGDGIVQINGENIHVGPFPGNCPPYLGYALLDGTRTDTGFRLLRYIATSQLESIVVGSDGVSDLQNVFGSLQSFLSNDLFFRNADAIRRRLAVINRDSVRMEHGSGRIFHETGCLEDDTTLIVMRRRK